MHLVTEESIDQSKLQADAERMEKISPTTADRILQLRAKAERSVVAAAEFEELQRGAVGALRRLFSKRALAIRRKLEVEAVNTDIQSLDQITLQAARSLIDFRLSQDTIHLGSFRSGVDASVGLRTIQPFLPEIGKEVAAEISELEAGIRKLAADRDVDLVRFVELMKDESKADPSSQLYVDAQCGLLDWKQ